MENTHTLTKKNNSKVLGFEAEEVRSMVSKLNLLLCNEQIHYQKLRNYHWNVVGEDFFDLHEQFEQEYNAAKMEIDEIAERIRVFGHTPVSTLERYLKISEIKETGTNLESREMVKEILNDFEILFSFMVEVIDYAKSIGDLGTHDMVAEFLQRKEKRHWMLKSFIQKSGQPTS